MKKPSERPIEVTRPDSSHGAVVLRPRVLLLAALIAAGIWAGLHPERWREPFLARHEGARSSRGTLPVIVDSTTRAERPDPAVQSGQAAPDAPAADGRLPRFGQYVYVEDLPEKLTHVQPEYPEMARRNGIEGTVLVQALVDPHGDVVDVRVVKSIPPLDAAAVGAVSRWKFKPARARGTAVGVWVGCPVRFQLR